MTRHCSLFHEPLSMDFRQKWVCHLLMRSRLVPWRRLRDSFRWMAVRFFKVSPVRVFNLSKSIFLLDGLPSCARQAVAVGEALVCDSL